MLRVARCTVVAASITLVLAGCQDAAAPSHGSPALGATPTMSIQANPPFVLHQVPPASTDNNIDKWLSDHFVWLYPGAERGEKLFVHLPGGANPIRSEEHTSELQSPCNLVCRLLLEKKKKKIQRCRYVY